MEFIEEALKANLAPALSAGVYIGSEHLEDERQLPVVIIVPTTDLFTNNAPARGMRGPIWATTELTVDIHCKAGTYSDARLIVIAVLEAMGRAGIVQPNGHRIRYSSEPYANRTIRVATLTVTVPQNIQTALVGLAEVDQIIMRARLGELPPL